MTHKFEIDTLKGVIDPVDLLESLGVNIASISGDEIICHCPFTENHKNGDRNPSFSLNSTHMVYNCFTCGGGNVVQLVRRLNNSTADEAEDYLIKSFNPLTTTKSLRDEIMKRFVKEEKEELPSYPMSILDDYHQFHDYMLTRNVSKDVCRDMLIGYDIKHNGITIPHVFKGKLVGWQTRHLLTDEATGNNICMYCGNSFKHVPKYINSPHFPKKQTLYNYSNALEYADLNSTQVIVVESPMSVLRLITEGYKASVATFGSWTIEQIGLLTCCNKGVLLWPDNDQAGEQNLARAIEYLLAYIPDVKIIPVVGKAKGDAGDLDTEAIHQHIANAYSPWLFMRNGMLNLQEAIEWHSKNLETEKK